MLQELLKDMKPNDVYVGLVDFFSIVLPGALLTFLCLPLKTHIFGNVLPQIQSDSAGWVIFAFAAYLFGQFISLIGATFMDWLYDETYLKYRRRKGDERFDKARELAGANGTMIGVLKWARAFVRLHSSEASLECDRFEATSKFFRSLFVVLLAYGATFAVRQDWGLLILAIALLILAFWRFCNQRWKLTECSYIYFIAIAHAPADTKGECSPTQHRARAESITKGQNVTFPPS